MGALLVSAFRPGALAAGRVGAAERRGPTEKSAPRRPPRGWCNFLATPICPLPQSRGGAIPPCGFSRAAAAASRLTPPPRGARRGAGEATFLATSRIRGVVGLVLRRDFLNVGESRGWLVVPRGATSSTRSRIWGVVEVPHAPRKKAQPRRLAFTPIARTTIPAAMAQQSLKEMREAHPEDWARCSRMPTSSARATSRTSGPMSSRSPAGAARTRSSRRWPPRRCARSACPAPPGHQGARSASTW